MVPDPNTDTYTKATEQEKAEHVSLDLSEPRLALARKELVFNCLPEKKGKYVPSEKTSKNMKLRERSKAKKKRIARVELANKEFLKTRKRRQKAFAGSSKDKPRMHEMRTELGIMARERYARLK